MLSFLKHFLKDERGGIVLLSAFTLPLVLMLMTLVIEGSLAQMRFSQITAISSRAAEDALLVLANQEWVEGDQRYQELCAQGNCPEPGSSSSYFTTEEVIAKYIKNPEIETKLRQEVENFIRNFDKKDEGILQTIDVRYPYNYQEGRRTVDIAVEITEQVPLYFLKYLRETSTLIKARGKATLTL